MNVTSITANAGFVPFHSPSVIASSQIADSKTRESQDSSTSIPAAEPGVRDCTPEADCRSDAQLISSVCCDPPDEKALGVLVMRYWKQLFAHCQLLTLNREKANDLAQSAWYRFLRARQGLKPDGNLSAYLAAIATNLFRDSYRSSRRAGPMADYRLESLDAPLLNDDGEEVLLIEIVADTKSAQQQAETLLAIDIDGALEQLTPQLREVIIARFINGESCAEIGLQHERTEQTVSGWVRQALRQMKTYLERPTEMNESKKTRYL